MELRAFLEAKAREYGDRTAIVCGNQRLSYSEVDRISNRVANRLAPLINKGDRAAILLPNGIEFAAIYLGVVKIGGIAVPLDPRYKTAELLSIFNSCQPKVLVAESDCLEQVVPHLSEFRTVEHVIEIGSRFKGRFLGYDEIMSASSGRVSAPELSAEDAAHLGYTSGPTSSPWGATLSHHNLLREAGISATAYRQTERDVMILFALPMNHVFGLIDGLMGTLWSSGRLVILPGLSLTSLTELIEREKGTIFMGVPYIYVLLTHMAEQEGIKNDLSSLRLCVSGGDCLPDDIALGFKKRFGLNIDQIWGLTEASASVTCTFNGTWKLGSAGRPIPGWELKIVDGQGRTLPPRQPGEILVRGNIMQGYYNNPERTACAIEGGWLHTGDIGQMDDGGDIYIVGRKKNMIIVKGQNIYPADIERVLSAHPLITEAAVIGIPNHLRGEIVGAAIVLKKGQATSEEDIRRFCRQYLINYKVPKRIKFLDSLPRTAQGTVRVDHLRQLFLSNTIGEAD